MQGRTTSSTVHFAAPFRLKGIEGILPAGDYEVDHDEEPIEGISFLAYRRVATFIHVPAGSTRTPNAQLFSIDPADLDAALAGARGAMP